jgi:hypothetical protein
MSASTSNATARSGSAKTRGISSNAPRAWIGGASALAAATARYLRAGDRADLRAFLEQSAQFGQRVIGPSSLVVLLSGLAMVVVGGIGFHALWVRLGLAGVLVHFVFGALVMRRRNVALSGALSAAPLDESRIASAARALRTGTLTYLLIMTLVIVIMVTKPAG